MKEDIIKRLEERIKYYEEKIKTYQSLKIRQDLLPDALILSELQKIKGED